MRRSRFQHVIELGQRTSRWKRALVLYACAALLVFTMVFVLMTIIDPCRTEATLGCGVGYAVMAILASKLLLMTAVPVGIGFIEGRVAGRPFRRAAWSAIKTHLIGSGVLGLALTRMERNTRHSKTESGNRSSWPLCTCP